MLVGSSSWLVGTPHGESLKIIEYCMPDVQMYRPVRIVARPGVQHACA